MCRTGCVSWIGHHGDRTVEDDFSRKVVAVVFLGLDGEGAVQDEEEAAEKYVMHVTLRVCWSAAGALVLGHAYMELCRAWGLFLGLAGLE